MPAWKPTKKQTDFDDALCKIFTFVMGVIFGAFVSTVICVNLYDKRDNITQENNRKIVAELREELNMCLATTSRDTMTLGVDSTPKQQRKGK
jgi:hypothetical protein